MGVPPDAERALYWSEFEVEDLGLTENDLHSYGMANIREIRQQKSKALKTLLSGRQPDNNISIDHLNLIEEGDVNNLPRYTLVNGFIKTYAKFIGADLNDEFSELEKKKVKGQVENRKTIVYEVSLKHLIIFISIFFLLLVFFYNN